jgi:geranylgeranyl diphosphate synthase, type I
MFDFLENPKKDITKFLNSFLLVKEKKFHKYNKWGPDLIRKYRDFCQRGKLIRGSIVIWSHDVYSGTSRKDAIIAGSALELFQSAILIHDDIIDNDDKRRGKRSFFADYAVRGKQENIKSSADFGKGMAICAADVGFFLVYEILSGIKNSALLKEMLEIVSQEFEKVGLGEMQDIYMGMSSKEFSEKEILTMYRYKTARYTFSLPLVMGCVLAGKKNDIALLEKLGELMGLIYQTTDDFLGIFGKTSETRKPVGNDITANKKTLFRFYLHKILKSYDVIQKLFGRQITMDELIKLRIRIKKEGISEKIGRLISEWEKESLSLIFSLHISESYKNNMHVLLNWLKNRDI